MSELEIDFLYVNPVWKILVVDDVLVHRKHLIRELTNYPIETEFTEATTAEDAIAMLASNRFDICFLDVEFPGISGLEALEAAREQGSRTFVTIVSGSRPDNYIEIGRKLGAYDYLAKPINREVLYAILDCYAEIRRTKSVLLIDDSGTARKIMRRILEKSMFALEIDEAESAVIGFEKYAARRCDVVMLDLNMDEMSGETALRIFRAAFPTVPVVLVSADHAALDGSGVKTFLKKPFKRYDIDDLLYQFSGLRPPFSGMTGRHD